VEILHETQVLFKNNFFIWKSVISNGKGNQFSSGRFRNFINFFDWLTFYLYTTDYLNLKNKK